MLAKTYACSSGGVHFSSRSRHCSPSARGARLPRGRLNRRIINIGVPSGGQARPASIQVARLSMLCLYGGNVSEPVVMQRSDLRRYPLPGGADGMGLFPSPCPFAWVRSLARCDTINWEDKFRLCARSPAKGGMAAGSQGCRPLSAGLRIPPNRHSMRRRLGHWQRRPLRVQARQRPWSASSPSCGPVRGSVWWLARQCAVEPMRQ